VDKVPNALPGRNNVEVEIYGMEGIPEEDLRAHEAQKKLKGDAGVPQASGDTDDEDDARGIPMPGAIQPPPPPMNMPPAAPAVPPPVMGYGMNHMNPAMGMRPMGFPMMGQMGYGMGQRMPSMGMPPMPSHPPPPNPMMGGARPLFPAAAADSASPSPAPPAAPPRPTFPAYSTVSSVTNNSPNPMTIAANNHSSAQPPSAVISAAPTIKKPEASSSGMTIKLIHPDEDISLEERRAQLPKYCNGPSRATIQSGGSDYRQNPSMMGAGPPMMGMQAGAPGGMGYGPPPGMMGQSQPYRMQMY
jgi:hypothetical protein